MKQSNQKVMKWKEKSLLPCPLKVHLKYHILIRILDERNGLKKDKQNTILGGEIFTGTSVLSVPWCEQFSENEAQGKLWAFWNRWCVHCTLQTFCNVHQKMFTNSLLCSLLWLNEQTNISILQGNNHKMLSHLESNFKHRLILVDIRFGNEGISPGWYIQF